MMKLTKHNLLKYSLLLFSIQFVGSLCNAQSVTAIKQVFQKTYDSWKFNDSIRIFNTDNLYDYIDGAADNYLSNNFQELLVATYNITEEKYITIEVYQHQLPMDAFGIYAQERPLHGKFSKIGAQGYQESGILNFLCDRYYIKMMSHDQSPETNAVISRIASDVAQKLDPRAQLPQNLQYLPSEGKIENSEAYVNTNFLGYEFLKGALLASYGDSEKLFKVFIIEQPSIDKAGDMVAAYMKKAQSPFDGKPGKFTVTDPHNGQVLLAWKGKYIWGIVNEKKVAIGKDYLQLVQDKLPNL
jgi:hypothetical protein